ncbi:hypothetical protein EG329_008565 [Mollisiaceae sp. DMI_Dod_QoI]|nr:hypothetical protein EG329_008565 [Helotiales sp. DMI_Dod_QoI]
MSSSTKVTSRPHITRGSLSPFNTFIIKVEVRKDPSLGLTDPASETHLLPVTLLLHEKYILLPSEKIRPGHLSWSNFCNEIERLCGFLLDAKTCEVGFKAESRFEGLGEEYFEISSELTFQNALAVLYNNWEWIAQPTALPIHLWNPRPREPIFRRSSRARDNSQLSKGVSPIVLSALKAPAPAPLQPIVEKPSEATLEVQPLPDGNENPCPILPAKPTTELPKDSSVTLVDGESRDIELTDVNDEETVTETLDDNGIEFDPGVLLKHLPTETIPEPDREDFENEEDYDNAMAKYLNYLRERELGSQNHWLKEKLGVSVCLAPPGLQSIWLSEHSACFRNENMGQYIFKAHGSSSLKNEHKDFLRGTKIPQGNHEPDIYKPRLRNGQYFIVTTPESFANRFLSEFTHKKTWGNEKTYKEVKRKNDVQKRQNKHLETKLQADWGPKAYHRVALILLSGTPLMTGPLDISTFVELMRRDAWKKDPVLKNWMGTELAALGNQWKKWTESRSTIVEDISRDVNQKFSPLVERLIIRRTTNSKLLGQKVVVVPKNMYSDVECDNGSFWNEKVDSLGHAEALKLEEREKKRKNKYVQKNGSLNGYKPLDKTNDNVYYRSRLCASFPYLMELRYPDGSPLQLTEHEWLYNTRGGDDAKWVPETKSDPYYANLQRIVESSGKLRAIKAKLKKYMKFKDGEGKLARQIFCSYFFTGAYIMYLWMVHILGVPKFDVIFIYKPMGPKKIDAELARFHVNPDNEAPAKDQKTARYIISTSSSFAVGLTLAEAISVGFLEPDYHADTVAQGFYRHCRQGNKNLENGVESFMFFAKDNAVEGRIRNLNEMRTLILKAATRKTKEAMKSAKANETKSTL